MNASMFFIIVFIHILGIAIMVLYTLENIMDARGHPLMMATAFMGYVLPWGQRAFGGLHITNLFSAFPNWYYIVTFLWGVFIDNPTLSRFFVLHYLLPFAIWGGSFTLSCAPSTVLTIQQV